MEAAETMIGIGTIGSETSATLFRAISSHPADKTSFGFFSRLKLKARN
jgi:hypothetical protein